MEFCSIAHDGNPGWYVPFDTNAPGTHEIGSTSRRVLRGGWLVGIDIDDRFDFVFGFKEHVELHRCTRTSRVGLRRTPLKNNELFLK